VAMCVKSIMLAKVMLAPTTKITTTTISGPRKHS